MPEKTQQMDIGVIGLGVMGKNLALNIVDNGFNVAAYDLDALKVSQFLSQFNAESSARKYPSQVIGCESIQHLLDQLVSPKIVVLSVPAGAPVDGVCHALIEAGIQIEDIVVDTGNSLWTDTVEREKRYKDKFSFFSSAVSGGETGARFGPCLMPSGDANAWERIAPIWHSISAKVDSETGLPIERTSAGEIVENGDSCTTYIGGAGAGHYVKMVHNGIEYADMQLICEAYHILSSGCGMTASEIGKVFEKWNQGKLNSYLVEISADVLQQADPETNRPLVEMILDKAGQKGTGLWTAVSSLQLGCPAPTIAEAVSARAISTQKSLRVSLSAKLAGKETNEVSLESRQQIIDQLENALYCAKIASYAQGFQLMAMAAKEQGWNLDFAEISKIWRSGCIIRASFLQSITQAYQQQANLAHLFLAYSFAEQLSQLQQNWRQATSFAVLNGIPTPCISSALAYYDSFRSETLPANLLQGQRDYFGAHTYERIDKKSGKKFHLEWSSTSREQISI
ncbi:NADP-dependent phosphogluconate dehydrogenase [Parashewanella curva]|uniref:6-phosphogluconate dehydrogenase, decarboxylating n=1 Tax=Parashewanella curva TaxID=2338552 RepID=A0A3L8PY39_9GAMM|nr:NADP-dependent phosphogluconate dehydrogenase [Parashewanella curva]RLV59729.1 NADP-dependent phosphogluconate dehydrogenase [Parashewanella curva]